MKVAILTTNTIHHIYFIQQAIAYNLDIYIFCAKPKLSKNYKSFDYSFESQKKLFETKRDKYELLKWFNAKHVDISMFSNLSIVDSVNSPESIIKIDKISPDLILVFGTGLIKETLLNNFKNKIFNLHGGNPEKYRGLDSHYWSIYHRDFEGLITTLHEVEPEFDTGNIILQGKINLWPNMQLHELRASNTELCFELFKSLVNMYQKNEKVYGKKQKTLGRYYSMMPEVLKHDVSVKFEKYIALNFSK